MEECFSDPVGIILVSSGSKGDRLLFRYPYQSEGNTEESVKSSKSPYALNSLVNPFSQQSKVKSSIRNGQLVGYSDNILTNLLAVKSDLCGKKFELKIDDVLFVGFPLLLQSGNHPQSSNKKDQLTMISFNVVFALRTNVSPSVINCYHDLAKQIAVALRHEQRRCYYLSQQKSIMWGIQDDMASQPEDCMESPFPHILQKSQLAKHMKHIYDSLCRDGLVLLRINKWVDISFCLPHKAHNMSHNSVRIEPEAVQRCLTALRPYHAVLLLVDANKLLDSLPLDGSPSLIRLIKVANPLKSLQSLASDADLALSQVFRLVSHLVYWAKATIIYPLCESNVYAISPKANTAMNSALSEDFTEAFPNAYLASVLSEFSLPTPYGEHRDFLGLPHQQTRQIEVVIWLLQHCLLMQLHTYVYLLPNAQHQPVSRSRMTSQNMSSDDSGEFNRSSSYTDVESLASEGSPNWNRPSSADESTGIISEEMQGIWRMQESLLRLTPLQRQSIMAVPAASNPDDLKLLGRLSAYFDGKHHLEDIMYYENVRRSQLLTLLDKFRSILVTCTHQDPATAFHVTP